MSHRLYFEFVDILTKTNLVEFLDCRSPLLKVWLLFEWRHQGRRGVGLHRVLRPHWQRVLPHLVRNVLQYVLCRSDALQRTLTRSKENDRIMRINYFNTSILASKIVWSVKETNGKQGWLKAMCFLTHCYIWKRIPFLTVRESCRNCQFMLFVCS